MEFRLLYEGPLVAANKGKTRAVEKQALRRHFHKQLARLWMTNPNLLRMAHQQGFYAALSRTGSVVDPDSLIAFNQQPGVFAGVLASHDDKEKLAYFFAHLRSVCDAIPAGAMHSTLLCQCMQSPKGQRLTWPRGFIFMKMD